MRRSFWLLPVAVLVGAAAIGFGLLGEGRSQAAGEQPSPKVLACGTCHSMEKQVSTWEQGPHQAVACLQCHDEGDPGWVRHEFVEKNTDMSAHAPADLRTPELKAENDRCLTCHDKQLEMLKQDLTPPPVGKGAAASADTGKPLAIKAAHDVHLNGKAKLTCVDCHAQSAHGPVPGTDAWRDDAHSRCQTCHDQQQVTLKVTGDVSCSACHVDPAGVAPADHKDATAWMKTHGQASQTQSCGTCHLSETAGAHTALANPTAFPSTQSQDACAACHAGVTMPHAANYLANHGQAYLAAKEGTCETCHSPERTLVTPVPEYAQPQFCTACHLQSMPHPANYLAAHGEQAMNQPATCEACHSRKNPAKPQAAHASTNFCASCHDAYQHPAGWVAGHGTKVDATCATCHTMQGQPGQHNACASCHTGEKWHPDLFFVSHGREVEQNGKEGCMTCHNEVQPSCTQCHRDP
jgi:predicted CXXCH cytochrome family protein